MTWRPHVVRQGEYLEKLAHRYGFVAEDVWNDARNAELRALRPNPAMLAPGDRLVMPMAESPGVALRAGAANRYRARVPTIGIEIVFGGGAEVYAREPYVIEGLPGGEQAGETDDEGRVRFRAPITTGEVTLLLVNRGVSHPVRIGHLDPIEEDSGVRQRLRHLGYFGHWIGRGDPEASGERDRRAIASFQGDHAPDLEVTGHADEATRQKLVEVHGG